MPLYERLTKLGMAGGETAISVHAFMAAIAELRRGKCTQAEIHTAFNLNATEQGELTTLLSKIVQRFEAIPFGGYVVLTNVASTYDGTNAQRGLGFMELDTSGVNGLDFTVQVNKIGSGTQSWQLWNETDGTQVGVIDDAASTGNKTLSTTISGLTLTGIKRFRVRAKSTVNTDDPVYYGACVRIHRLNTLSGVELHDILLLAEKGKMPHVDSISEVKARLGV